MNASGHFMWLQGRLPKLSVLFFCMRMSLFLKKPWQSASLWTFAPFGGNWTCFYMFLITTAHPTLNFFFYSWLKFQSWKLTFHCKVCHCNVCHCNVWKETCKLQIWALGTALENVIASCICYIILRNCLCMCREVPEKQTPESFTG